ncbi:MAG: hypothetical protein CVV41_09495 [Candidatus Riflebacteria bacterium HGW-Riflebacteria-1]|jgi:protein TonB|nr:MAG: hypothetical protein CVV41_09495 [Candidatus Riflebacteria bacterium HGW-Riflebacteria-1]
MTAKILQLRDGVLWPLSIVSGLVLQIVLASFLWGICTSFDSMHPPVLQLIRLSPAVAVPQPLENKVVPVIEAPQAESFIEPKPVIEQVKAVEPATVDPVKPPPASTKAKPDPVRPRPVTKAATKPNKVEAQTKPVMPPAAVAARPAAIVAQPAEIKDARDAALPQTSVKTPDSTVNTATSLAPASPKDFSSYLQKIYRQLEKNRKYPASARRRGISGKVAVAFSINSEGKAVGAAVTNRAPRELSAAALELVASQRFERPPEGWNNASRIEMQINYSLR